MLSKRTTKTVSIADAAALVENGSRITLGGFAIYQRPMAFTRELVRQKKQNLTIVGVTNGLESDMLIGAGCVRRIETSYVGLEKFGLARNYRRESEAGRVQTMDLPELLGWDRFRASQENLAFWPAAGLGGTDIVAHNPEIKQFLCPTSGQILHALPSAAPDVVVLHALAADEFGNVVMPSHRLLPQSQDIVMSRACDTVIVTVEKIVPTSFIERHARLVEIPAWRTTALVEAPFGAHPTQMLGRYGFDEEHFDRYVTASQSAETFQDYLEKFVRGPADQWDYLDEIGARRLARILKVDNQQ